MSRSALIAALVLCISVPAVAAIKGFYIIRGADRQCSIVGVPPDATQTTTAHLGTRVGNNIYITREEAEADMSLICDRDQMYSWRTNRSPRLSSPEKNLAPLPGYVSNYVSRAPS
jgi:hypothetical protein